jgi:homoaconitase/3-isopropylmalate dehydratase large subunit
MSQAPSTLFDKVWDAHVVRKIDDGPDVFFIDRHFIHEVTSPVAFLGMESRKVGVIFPERTFATADHNTRPSTSTFLCRTHYLPTSCRPWRKIVRNMAFLIGDLEIPKMVLCTW